MLLFSLKHYADQLSRNEAIQLLNNGIDVSNFGDPSEWQREVRKDRKID
jgi:hypothetical protein